MHISRNAFTNLASSMIGFGVVIGLGFPFAVLAAGVPASVALTPGFLAFTVAAGCLVGGVNILLARLLVRPKLRLMAHQMHEVEEGLKHATYTGDWTNCDPDECALPVDSEDEFGEAAAAFNRLLRALAESHTVEERITDFTNAMSAELDVQAICRAAIDCFRRDLGATGVAIIGGLGGGLEVLASHGLTDPGALVETDLVRHAIRSLRTDSMSMPEHLVIDAAVARLKPQHVIVYPLVLESTAIGAVVLASSGEVPRSAQALGPLFIRTLSVALSNALSHESMRRIAAIDGLTGLLNRRVGLDRLEHDYVGSVHRGHPIGVIMVDIDHFKQVNDDHGHLAGDAVLREVASAAAAVLRGDDYLVRYGGEEFLAVLPGAGSAQIAEIAERVRAGATAQPVTVDGVEVFVTVSAGYATTEDQRVDDAMTLVARADEALLLAKRSGRNRSVSALALTA
ncbi:MAG: sensor domain-containing diguanylate cyclase [Actinobacteria bacterium]|nr:sensor domain-containing diguanylate cyclase [Actinomycetota bacterium]